MLELRGEGAVDVLKKRQKAGFDWLKEQSCDCRRVPEETGRGAPAAVRVDRPHLRTAYVTGLMGLGRSKYMVWPFRERSLEKFFNPEGLLRIVMSEVDHKRLNISDHSLQKTFSEMRDALEVMRGQGKRRCHDSEAGGSGSVEGSSDRRRAIVERQVEHAVTR